MSALKNVFKSIQTILIEDDHPELVAFCKKITHLHVEGQKPREGVYDYTYGNLNPFSVSLRDDFNIHTIDSLKMFCQRHANLKYLKIESSIDRNDVALKKCLLSIYSDCHQTLETCKIDSPLTRFHGD